MRSNSCFFTNTAKELKESKSLNWLLELLNCAQHILYVTYNKHLDVLPLHNGISQHNVGLWQRTFIFEYVMDS